MLASEQGTSPVAFLLGSPLSNKFRKTEPLMGAFPIVPVQGRDIVRATFLVPALSVSLNSLLYLTD